MNLNIRGLNKSGIRFNEVSITCANVKNAGLFSLILPYTLFNGFELSGAEPFDLVYFDTPNNQINYKAIAGVNDTVCGAYICTDENIFTKHSNMEKVSVF